jgi:hypothetical protein
MGEAVLGADSRHAVLVELDPVAGAELVGVEGAVLGAGVPFAEEVLEASRRDDLECRQGSSPAFQSCATGRAA